MENSVTDLYTPKYIQIQNFVLDRISGGDFRPGDRIPSECELAKSFDVSRITANAAIKELATRGVVERVRGKGTFVLPQAAKDDTGLPMVFASGIKLNPLNLSDRKEHMLLHHGVVVPSGELQRKLSLREGELAYQIVRLVNVGGRPGELDYSYLPMSVCASRDMRIQRAESGCMHDYLKECLGCNPRYIRIFINTQVTSDIDLSPLGIEESEGLFIWDTYVYGEKSVLALTTTVSAPQKDKPFITLEL